MKKDADRKTRYAKKIYKRKTTKLPKKLDTGDRVLVLAERLKKKDAPRKFYKSSTQNKSFFNNDKIFLTTKEMMEFTTIG